MNESGFTRKIHKLLPKEHVYSWKISDRYTAGIPDAYYSGTSGDMWVEYKYCKVLNNAAPKLTELQKKWLRERHAQGRKVAVIVGFATGHARIFEGLEWDDSNNFSKPLVSHANVATYLVDQTCGQ